MMGRPLSAHHTGPCRLIFRRLYLTTRLSGLPIFRSHWTSRSFPGIQRAHPKIEVTHSCPSCPRTMARNFWLIQMFSQRQAFTVNWLHTASSWAWKFRLKDGNSTRKLKRPKKNHVSRPRALWEAIPLFHIAGHLFKYKYKLENTYCVCRLWAFVF